MIAVHGTHTKAVMRILSVDDSEGLEEEEGVWKEWDVLVDMLALLNIELVGILDNILDVIMAIELVYMELIEVEGNGLSDTTVVMMLMMSIEGVDI